MSQDVLALRELATEGLRERLEPRFRLAISGIHNSEVFIVDVNTIGKTAIKIYGFSGGIRPGVGLQGGIRATSTLQ